MDVEITTDGADVEAQRTIAALRLEIKRLTDDSELVWEDWQPYHIGSLTEYRVGRRTIHRLDLSTDTTRVMEKQTYLQTRYAIGKEKLP